MIDEFSVHERERELQRFGNVAEPPGGAPPKLQRSKPPVRRDGFKPSPIKQQSRGPMTTNDKISDQRVAIAIDVQNLYYGAKDIYGTKVAYQRFLEKVLNNRKLIRSIAYIANRDGNNQGSFIKLMRTIGCDIRQKQVIERSSGLKCNWDVEIAVDALSLASKIDTFVLASGDGDFTYLLRALKMQGVRTEVVAFRANTANSLMDEADEYRDISKDMLIETSQAWKNKPKSGGPDDNGGGGDGGRDGEIHDKDDDFYEEPEYPE